MVYLSMFRGLGESVAVVHSHDPVAGPNLLILMTDQQRHDQLGCTSDGHFETPTLDALASRGVLFEQAYSSSTICAPARGSLLTGLHPHRYPGHAPLRSGGRSLQPGFWTAPHVLRQAGYQTAVVGKGHYRPIHADHGFSHMRMVEHLATYKSADNPVDDYTRWLVWQGKADWRATHRFGPDDAKAELDFRQQRSALPFHYAERYHPSHWVADEAIAFLAKREPARPYCLLVSFPHPHAPWDPPEPWASRYDPGTAVFDPQADLVNQHLPPRARGLLSGKEGYGCLRIDQIDAELVRRILTYIRALIGHIDACVERLMRAVDLDDTVVFFTSDHGDYYARRGLLRKSPFLPMEDLARVPFFCLGPGIGRGRRVPQPVQSGDMVPTLLAQAGLPVPDVELDGRDLSPVLGGSPADPERTIFCSSFAEYPMVRRGRYKYFRHLPSGEEMLFDLSADPAESSSRLGDQDLTGVLTSLRQALRDQLLMGIPDLPRFDNSCGQAVSRN